MSATIEHNRRAVYTALSGVCGDRLLLERAFGFWETNFSANAVFRVAQYIDGLMGYVGLNQEQRRALSVALYSALNKQDRELAEVPAMFRATAAGAAAPATASASVSTAVGGLSAQAAVFAAVIGGLIEGASRSGKADDLMASLEDAQSRVAPSARAVLAEWLQGGLAETRRFAACVPDTGHAAVVNHVYVALCDAVGPVLSDRILGRAVSAAEQLPEAIDCTPRSLL